VSVRLIADSRFGEQQMRKHVVQKWFLFWEHSEVLARGTKQTTRELVVTYKVIKVSWSLSGEDLIRPCRLAT